MAQYDKLINLGLLNQFLTKAKTIFAPKITASGILKGDGNGGVSAATAGTDYVTPAQSLALGLTGASVGDLVRVNAVDATGKPTSWKHVPLNEIKCNKNLLDNWYFVGGGSQLGDGVFPINQRGQTTYSGAGYGIDRWLAYQGYVNIAITSDGINITRSAGSFHSLIQKINNLESFRGKKVTVSMLSTGYNRIRLFANNVGIADSGETSTSNEIVSAATAVIPNDTTGLFVSIYTSNAYSTVVKAVKLELGDTQTLAHNEGTEESPVWVLNEIPDYGEELRKCQRYYVKYYSTTWRIIGSVQIDNNIQRCLVVLPVSMADNPKSIAVNGQMQFLCNPGITITSSPTSCAIENANLYMYYTQNSSAQTGLFPIRLNASTLEISCEP